MIESEGPYSSSAGTSRGDGHSVTLTSCVRRNFHLQTDGDNQYTGRLYPCWRSRESTGDRPYLKTCISPPPAIVKLLYAARALGDLIVLYGMSAGCIQRVSDGAGCRQATVCACGACRRRLPRGDCSAIRFASLHHETFNLSTTCSRPP